MSDNVEKNERRLDKRILIIYLLSFVVLQVVALTATLLIPDMQEDAVLFARVLSILNLLWYGGLTVILFKVARIYLFKNQWIYFTQDIPRSIGLVAIGFGAVLAANAIINVTLMQMGLDVDPENQAALEGLLEGGPIAIAALILFAGIFAPIVEELVFRKGLWDIIERFAGLVGAIVLNSLAFGLIHILADLGTDSMAWVNMIPYFAMGLMISLIYYFSGKIIFVPIFVHIVYNMFALLAIFLIF